MLEQRLAVLRKHIPTAKSVQHEESIEVTRIFSGVPFILKGRMDIIAATYGKVWEIKCRNALDDEYRMQLAVISFLWIYNEIAGFSSI